MNGLVQLLVFLLIIISFGLVIAVPVIVATPGDWERFQRPVWIGAGLWLTLVSLISVVNPMPS